MYETADFEFTALVTTVGELTPVAFFEFPDLSIHVVNTLPFEGTTPEAAGSAPSSHKAHPAILLALKKLVFFTCVADIAFYLGTRGEIYIRMSSWERSINTPFPGQIAFDLLSLAGG